MASSTTPFIPSEMRPPPTLNSDDNDSFEVLENPISIDMKSILSEECNEVEDRILRKADLLLNSKNDVESSSVVECEFSQCSSSTHTEVQKRLQEIVEENRRLNSIIAENNEKMKTMRDKLTEVANWQQEVQSIYQSHKIKFAEAKLLIDNLKLENTRLKTDMEKYKNIKELTENEMLHLKQQLKGNENSTTQNNQISEYVEKIKKLEESMQSLNLEVFVLKEANEKLKNVENDKSTDFCDKMVRALEEKLKEYEEKIQKLEMQNTMLLKKNEALEDSAEVARNQAIQSEEREKALNEELDQLKKELVQAKVNPEELVQLRQQLMNSQIKITEIQQKLKESEERVVELEKTLEDNKVLMETKQNEIGAAEEKVKAAEALNDEVFALKAQLELYKNDFDTEKQLSMETKRNCDQLVSDLRNLQRRNEELQEEIDLMRQQGFVLHSNFSSSRQTGTVPRTTTTTTSSTPSAPRENDEFSVSNRIKLLSKRHSKVVYPCPKCNFRFWTIDACQNHVERCLELDDVLP